MRSILLILFLLPGNVLLFGQEIKNPDSLQFANLSNLREVVEKMKSRSASPDLVFGPARGDTSKLPLFVINDTITTNDSKEFILSPKSIGNIETLKPNDAIKKFGDKARYGAFIIELKEGTELFQLPDLYSFFSIKMKNRELPVCLNDDFIARPSKILADVHEIKRMKVKEGRYWFYTTQITNPQKYINIETK